MFEEDGLQVSLQVGCLILQGVLQVVDAPPFFNLLKPYAEALGADDSPDSLVDVWRFCDTTLSATFSPPSRPRERSPSKKSE